MFTYYEYLAVLTENAPVVELERLKTELSRLPKVQKDELRYIDTTAAQEFLMLPHEKYGNLANYLLILLSENIAMPVSSKSGNLWHSFLYNLYTYYKYVGQPGLLLLNSKDVVLDLNIVTDICHRNKVLHAVYGRTGNDDYFDCEEVDELSEDVAFKPKRTTADMIRDLQGKRNEENQRHMDRIHSIDQRMRKLRDRQRTEQSKAVKYAHLKRPPKI